jgi:hypothetical protein
MSYIYQFPFFKDKIKKLILLYIALFTGNMAYNLQAQVNITSQVFAEVVPSFTVTEISQLNFGRFSPGIQGGELRITPEGVLYSLGTVVINSGLHSPASYSIMGEDNTLYSITLPAGPTTLINIRNSRTMVVDNWESYPGAGEGAGVIHGGMQIVSLGATLRVGSLADNPVGIYSGSYVITFGYN